MLIFSGYSISIDYNIKYKENKEQSVNLFFLKNPFVFGGNFYDRF